MSRLRADKPSIGGWLTQVVAWFVIATLLLLLTVAVLVPRFAGATPYTILTSSMEPGMPPGTLVVVRPVDAEDISIGDVITYQLESGRPTVVTHRVVGQGYDLAGKLTFTTRGDANDVVDQDPVMPVQVRGERWYSVPYLGHANTLLSGSQRQVAVVVVAGALLGYAGFMFAGSARDRRSKNKYQREEAPS